MPHYTFAKLEIAEFDWVGDYQEVVPKIIEQYGGKLLARTHKNTVQEGECSAPHVVLLVEFPDADAADSFYHSPEYAPYLEARLAGSTAEIHSFAGEDSIGAKS